MAIYVWSRVRLFSVGFPGRASFEMLAAAVRDPLRSLSLLIVLVAIAGAACVQAPDEIGSTKGAALDICA